MRIHPVIFVLAAVIGAVALPALAQAAEFYIGEPIVREGMQIVPNYLIGIEMDGMPPGMEMGPGATP